MYESAVMCAKAKGTGSTGKRYKVKNGVRYYLKGKFGTLQTKVPEVILLLKMVVS
jgi:hypothetical protein